MKQDETLEKTASLDLSERYDSKHIEVLEQYFAQAGEGIVLTAFQEKILKRLRFADEKIRQNNGRFKREQIANFIMTAFNVSRDTAFKDIVNAEHLFSSSYPLNKRYEMQMRIEFLKEQSRNAAAGNDWDSVARIEKVLLGYYESYPDITPNRAKKNFFLIYNDNRSSETGEQMSVEDALQIAENVSDDE